MITRDEAERVAGAFPRDGISGDRDVKLVIDDSATVVRHHELINAARAPIEPLPTCHRIRGTRIDRRTSKRLIRTAQPGV